jgi:hypothetical protein
MPVEWRWRRLRAVELPGWELKTCHERLACVTIPAAPSRVPELGRGATVAQRTLDPLILVRIRTPQPLPGRRSMSPIDEDPYRSKAIRLKYGAQRALASGRFAVMKGKISHPVGSHLFDKGTSNRSPVTSIAAVYPDLRGSSFFIGLSRSKNE